MSIKNLRAKISDYAKDIRINLSRVLEEEGSFGLKLRQIQLIALASAYATKNQSLVNEIKEEVSECSETDITAAKAAATIMAMNNIYYRFTHLVSDTDYRKKPAQLRMKILSESGVEKVDFELMSLAVSAINGCGMCMDSHEHVLVKAGVSKEGIQSTIRIASTLNAAAQALFIKEM